MVEISSSSFLEAGGALEQAWQKADGPVWYAVRRNGLKLSGTWCKPDDLDSFLLEVRRAAESSSADAVEVCFSHSYRDVGWDRVREMFSNNRRGLIGIEISFGPHLRRIAPTTTIATNRPLLREIDYFCHELGATPKAFRAQASLRAFEADQFLLRPQGDPAVVSLHRGATTVLPEEVDAHGIREMAASMARWMLVNLRADGNLTYKYWPSRGRESDADNTIRRFMATVCLFRAARAFRSEAMMRGADLNLRFNLDRFYLQQGRRGVVQWNGSAKLGAAALAALAILHHPQRARFGDELRSLLRGIDDLWQPDGSFRTFHFPGDRNDNQNFYPGEALLLWATLLKLSANADLHSRFMRSFHYYREWHRAARNPAFIPWHTQAYAIVHSISEDPELADFIFEMNDWLLPIQQWGGRLDPQLWGRFYDPSRPFGPPHASSTGVYMEGLADASWLARKRGDQARAEAYETAIWRGLRSIRQLQFRDEVDSFYVSKRKSVMGGVRTEAYDNEIRVDNVQHPLMAILKLLHHPEFRLASDAGRDQGSAGSSGHDDAGP